MSGKADFYADGQWNFYCDFCGAKTKSSDGMRTWNNFYVCKHHREERNPQDFLRGVKENQSLPWTRPKPGNQFVPIHYTRKFSDTVRVSEVINKTYTISAFAEGINVYESVRIGQTEVPEEVLMADESISLGINKTLSEVLELDESVSFSVGKALLDDVEVSEIIALAVTKNFSEEVGMQESVSIILHIHDPELLNGDVLNSQTLN